MVEPLLQTLPGARVSTGFPLTITLLKQGLGPTVTPRSLVPHGFTVQRP